MSHATDNFDQLAQEHRVLLHSYGRIQTRCTEQLCALTREVERLDTLVIRLRAEVIARESALAWIREDRAVLDALIPNLPRRATLAQYVNVLLARIQALLHPTVDLPDMDLRVDEKIDTEIADTTCSPSVSLPPSECSEISPAMLHVSQYAADLVICQTGCLSHGGYWRAQDHCHRTGKSCILSDQIPALQIPSTESIEAAEQPTTDNAFFYRPRILP